jgi:hypothetical protein
MMVPPILAVAVVVTSPVKALVLAVVVLWSFVMPVAKVARLAEQ